MNHACAARSPRVRRTRTLDVPRVVRSRGAAAFAIQTIRYTTGEELIRRERRASSKVLYMSRMTGMTDAVVVRSRRGAQRTSARLAFPPPTRRTPGWRGGRTAPPRRTPSSCSSPPPRTSPWTHGDAAPTATPMPMSAPSEMMERDVYTDWTLGMLRVREVSERVCGGARGERRSAPSRREAKKSSRGGFVCFTAQTMTFSREMRGSADAPRRLGERPRAANARERRVTSDANTSGPLERRRDARTRDPARPPSTRTWS